MNYIKSLGLAHIESLSVWNSVLDPLRFPRLNCGEAVSKYAAPTGFFIPVVVSMRSRPYRLRYLSTWTSVWWYCLGRFSGCGLVGGRTLLGSDYIGYPYVQFSVSVFLSWGRWYNLSASCFSHHGCLKPCLLAMTDSYVSGTNCKLKWILPFLNCLGLSILS